MNRKVAFVTGASRGIGADAAIALSVSGYKVAITARTLHAGEAHDHVGTLNNIQGSLDSTAAAIAAVVAWLADNDPWESWDALNVIRCPSAAADLGLL